MIIFYFGFTIEQMKVLIIRFSSIGDIVLSTPLLRVLAQHNDEKYEIHYITKEIFASVIENNPYVDKLYTFKKEITELISQLKKEEYNFIIDLHHNLRSRRLISLLHKPAKSFNKLNYEKWLRVHLKIDILPHEHIVERYINTVSFLGFHYDGEGLEYYITEQDEAVFDRINYSKNQNYVILVVGGAHFTKQIPDDMLVKIAKEAKQKVVLLGGKNDMDKASSIESQIGGAAFNLVGKLSLNESAALIKYAQKIVTPDTGLMHIAAAFKIEILSLWGNTIPEFGMYALLPNAKQQLNHIFEVKGLSCRPCSKIGYAKCPKKHFNCMRLQEVDEIIKVLNA